tara:strand:+ start:38 stop:223 length:186 start_codon:yes stop_codon:yes gene_type:complete
MTGIKKPGKPGSFQAQRNLFDFSFFVYNVLTNNGIKFFDLEFLRHGALVFVSGIEVTGTGT